jgi:hypothetical protein
VEKILCREWSSESDYTGYFYHVLFKDGEDVYLTESEVKADIPDMLRAFERREAARKRAKRARKQREQRKRDRKDPSWRPGLPTSVGKRKRNEQSSPSVLTQSPATQPNDNEDSYVDITGISDIDLTADDDGVTSKERMCLTQ